VSERTLGDVLDELAKMPRELIVRSAILKLRTDMGNVIDYAFQSGETPIWLLPQETPPPMPLPLKPGSFEITCSEDS
jgi:hypothetical protein